MSFTYRNPAFRVFAPVALALPCLALLASAARAQVTYDTEPNETFATATPTVNPGAGGDLTIIGSLTTGDIDTYSFYVTAGPGGGAISFDDTWSAGTNGGGPFVNWINERVFAPGGAFQTTSGSAHTSSGSTITSPTLPTGLYYLQICSSNPSPVTLGPILPSTVPGTYTLTHFHGLNGATVTGTAAPEPSEAVALGLGVLCLGGLILRVRKRKSVA